METLGKIAALFMVSIVAGIAQKGAMHIFNAGNEGSPSKGRVLKLVVGTIIWVVLFAILFAVFLSFREP